MAHVSASLVSLRLFQILVLLFVSHAPLVQGEEVRISKETLALHRESIIPDLIPLIESGLLEFPGDKTAKPLEGERGERSIDSILEGATSLFLTTPYSEFSFRLTKLEANVLAWRVRGTLARIQPPKLRGTSRSDQKFRERIEITHPDSLRGYALLTFRFISGVPDLLWLYSPFISRDRQLVATARTEPLFFSDLTPDDLFTWSAHPNSVSGTVAPPVPLLLPLRTVRTAWEAPCEGTPSSSPEGEIEWNFQRNVLPQRAGWLPINFPFSVRDTITLELTTKDLYSSYKRQVLYLDAASGMPLVKTVYGSDGKRVKTVLSFVDVQEDHTPRIRASLGYNYETNAATIWEHTGMKSCEVPSSDVLKRFDPKNLAPAQESSEKKKSSENEPQPSESRPPPKDREPS